MHWHLRWNERLGLEQVTFLSCIDQTKICCQNLQTRTRNRNLPLATILARSSEPPTGGWFLHSAGELSQ